MMFSIALVAAAASQAVTAFKVPEGTPDGIYQAYYDEAGKEVHVALGPIPSGAQPISSREASPLTGLQKRNRVWCGCGITMGGSACDQATHGVGYQTDHNNAVPAIGSTYAVSGDVVVFVCNHSRSVMYLNLGDVSAAWGQVTGNCGYYIAGTWQVSGDLTAGYMHSGQDFCAHDRDAAASRC